MNLFIYNALKSAFFRLLVMVILFIAGFTGAWLLRGSALADSPAKAIIGFMTAGLSVSGLGYCAVAAVWGNSRPHVYSWLIWTIVNAVAWYNQWTHGAGAGAWSTLVMTILSGVVFLIAAYQYISRISDDKITPVDQWCLAGAFISIVFLMIFKAGPASIVVAVITDALAFIPTLKKAWTAPGSETSANYLINTLRHIIALFAMQSYNFVTLLFPVSLIFLNALTVGIMLLRKNQKEAEPDSSTSLLAVGRAE